MVENDIRKNDAHPCIQYTKIRIEELKLEAETRAKMSDNLLSEPSVSRVLDNYSSKPKLDSERLKGYSTKRASIDLMNREPSTGKGGSKKTVAAVAVVFVVVAGFILMGPTNIKNLFWRGLSPNVEITPYSFLSGLEEGK
jgi:hypothetical protein